MIGIGKDLFYDWYGYNEIIFKAINGFQGGDTYETFVILLTQLADSKTAPYYFGAIVALVLVNYIIKKILVKRDAGDFMARWIAVLIVLAASLAVDNFVVHAIKDFMEYPRPYVVLGSEAHVMQYRGAHNTDDYASFPSGHVSLVTVFVIAMWPAINVPLRILGVLLIPLMGCSRMALGMHFPADVLGGFLVSLAIVLLIRAITYPLLRMLYIE